MATIGMDNNVPDTWEDERLSEELKSQRPSRSTIPPSNSSTVRKSQPLSPSISKVAGTTLPTYRDLTDTSKSPNADRERLDEDASADVHSEHINLVLIGHVDAGKSTLGGSILLATGMVDLRTIERLKREAKEAGREAWYLSWALDLTSEERSKGITVETGRAFFKLPSRIADMRAERHFTILDAPGHKSYVPSMIGGASQADIGVLVISARKGEYETGFEKGGQTREHAILVRNAGVKQLVVVVNKMDDPTVGWSESRFRECTVKVRKFLISLGYKSDDLTFIPISAQKSIGIQDRVSPEIAPWYVGPSLLQYFSTVMIPARDFSAPFMMPVSAKYRDMGIMVEGRIEAGKVNKHDECLLMPNRDLVSISAIYEETDKEIETASCGDQVRLRIRGLEDEQVMPGFVLCNPDHPVHCVSSFIAKVKFLDLKSIVCVGFSCILHVHSAVEEITVAALMHTLEVGTGRKSKRAPTFVSQGQTVLARLEVTRPLGTICVEKFEDHQQFGRFTLRDQGQTIAIGAISELLEESPH